MGGVERIDDVHPADRRLLGAFHDVLAGGHHLVQDAPAGSHEAVLCKKRQARFELQARRRDRNGAAVRAV